MNSRREGELHLDVAVAPGHLRQISVRGSAITFAIQVCKFTVQLISTALLARVLSPQDFGLVGMVMAIASVIGLLKDFGLSTATIQQHKITEQQVNYLFWLNVVLGALLALLAVLLSPVVAVFYGEPGLKEIMRVLALGFLISGLTVQHHALLRRQMRFGALAAADLASLIGGTSVALIMAWLGWGYWALVFQAISYSTIALVIVWGACRWRPGPPTRTTEVRAFLVFGGNLTGFEILAHIGRNAAQVMLGWYHGAEQVGYYGRALGLLLIPFSQITGALNTVVVPVLSRLASSPVHFRYAVRILLESVLLLSFPFLVLAIVAADWIVEIVLGAQWHEVGKVFAWMGLYGFAHPLGVVAVWILTTQGKTRTLFRWGIIDALLAVIGAAVGLKNGAEGVAAGFALTGLFVRLPILLLTVTSCTNFKVRDFLSIGGPHILGSILLFCVLLGLRDSLSEQSPLTGLSVLALASVGVFGSYVFLVPSCRARLIELRHALLSFRV
ncbi:MAG: lipopolysaccharide biosynthesis protein [Verrucomicrobiae bacterium]|nr:lipopolysaccharide biosynthesis protein [Verrucomicrobiae bacterium]